MKFVTATMALMLGLFLARPAPAQDFKGRDIFGARVGTVFSTMELDDAFGRGSELEIFFVGGVTSWFGIGAAISSHNFGKSKDLLKDQEFTGIPQPVSLMIYSVTMTLYGQRRLADRFTAAAESGGGLYMTSASIPAGVFLEGRITKNQPGVYGGASLSYRLTDGGFSLNLGGKFHYIFSGDHRRQALYVYTERDRTHFFQVTAGVTMFTGNR